MFAGPDTYRLYETLEDSKRLSKVRSATPCQVLSVRRPTRNPPIGCLGSGSDERPAGSIAGLASDVAQGHLSMSTFTPIINATLSRSPSGTHLALDHQRALRVEGT